MATLHTIPEATVACAVKVYWAILKTTYLELRSWTSDSSESRGKYRVGPQERGRKLGPNSSCDYAD
jgi:hypothetical protein